MLKAFRADHGINIYTFKPYFVKCHFIGFNKYIIVFNRNSIRMLSDVQKKLTI